MHFLFSDEGNRVVLDKVVLLRMRGKNCSPAREAVGELSVTIWFAKPTSFIYYIGFNKFDVLKTF